MCEALDFKVQPTKWKDGRFNEPSESPRSIEWEVKVLLYGLVCAIQPEQIVETGCNFGFTTRVLGAAAADYGGRVVTSDIEPGYVDATRERCEGLPVEVFLKASIELSELQRCDFAVLDSSFESRIEELDKLKVGCIVACHDTIEPSIAARMPLFRRRIEFPTAKGLTLIQIIERPDKVFSTDYK